jgi:Reverse transcriptase (RNA-dependent DNA polymerase)
VFLVVPFGLAGTPPNSQSLMNNVQRPYPDKFCLVYLDYILIYIRDEKEHLEHIRFLSAKLPEHRFFMSREAW